MSAYQKASKEAYRTVDETCPHVDAALDSASRLIKEQTSALRSALIDVIAERNEAQDKVEELEAELAELRVEIELLKAMQEAVA